VEFSADTWKARRELNDVCKMFATKNTLHVFQNKTEIKISLDKQKLRKFIPTPSLQEVLKGFFSS
jgi:hypothetical protein